MNKSLTPLSFAVSAFFDQYALPRDVPVLVGVSGGKDSLTLLLALREAGIEVRPAIVDLGYTNFDSEAISGYMSELGFTPLVLLAKRHASTEPAIARQLTTLNTKPRAGFTPCGTCTLVKRSLLVSAAEDIGTPLMAYGHHQDDFLATMLKDYFVYLYYNRHTQYDTAKFRCFIQSVEIDVEQVRELVDAGIVSTMARILPISGVQLVRPLSHVPEATIRQVVNELELRTFGSGCSHSYFFDPAAQPTKRELVHTELARQRWQVETPSLVAILEQCLTPLGMPRAFPRGRRGEMFPGFEVACER